MQGRQCVIKCHRTHVRKSGALESLAELPQHWNTLCKKQELDRWGEGAGYKQLINKGGKQGSTGKWRLG